MSGVQACALPLWSGSRCVCVLFVFVFFVVALCVGVFRVLVCVVCRCVCVVCGCLFVCGFRVCVSFVVGVCVVCGSCRSRRRCVCVLWVYVFFVVSERVGGCRVWVCVLSACVCVGCAWRLVCVFLMCVSFVERECDVCGSCRSRRRGVCDLKRVVWDES